MYASRQSEFRFCRKHHDLSARLRAFHGGNARNGARAHHAGRRWNLQARRSVVSGHDWRFYLDGPVVPAVVWGHRQKAGEISYLQRLEPASARTALNMKFAINRDRLVSEIQALGQISEAEPPVVTRVVFTDADLRARAWVIGKCKEAGLNVRIDAVGNTFACWTGSDASAPAVGTGSHIDAIPNAGKYDGVVGVLGGLEAIRALKAAGFQPKRSIELLIFTSEEPMRFGVGCLGSRMLSGTLSAESAAKLRDANNTSLDEVRQRAGFEGSLSNVRLAAGHYQAFVELHIEQGPILEREKISLGIVQRIAAPASANVFVEGSGGHAGGVLMPERKDALCAASELILEVERAARSTGSVDTV